MKTKTAETYYHDLDVARGVLMSLGVILHTANVFSPGAAALIHSELQSNFYLYLSESIHLFRMPAFFAVSGFFCWMSLKRYTVRKFLKVRSQRILVPLLTTAMTFNLIEVWLRARTSLDNIGFVDFITQGYLFEAYLNNDWVLHLWFLIIVFIYFVLSALVSYIIGKVPDKFLAPIAQAVKWVIEKKALIVVAGVIAAYIPLAMGKLLPNLIYTKIVFGTSLYTVLEYLPFFAFGAFLNYNPGVLKTLRGYSHLKMILFCTITISIPIFLHTHAINENLAVAIWAAGAWATTLTVFGLFSKMIEKLNVNSKTFAEPTYTIYLSHHLLVGVISALILQLSIPIAVQFILIITIILALTTAFHFFIIRKIPILRYLYNGK